MLALVSKLLLLASTLILVLGGYTPDDPSKSNVYSTSMYVEEYDTEYAPKPDTYDKPPTYKEPEYKPPTHKAHKTDKYSPPTYDKPPTYREPEDKPPKYPEPAEYENEAYPEKYTATHDAEPHYSTEGYYGTTYNFGYKDYGDEPKYKAPKYENEYMEPKAYKEEPKYKSKKYKAPKYEKNYKDEYEMGYEVPAAYPKPKPNKPAKPAYDSKAYKPAEPAYDSKTHKPAKPAYDSKTYKPTKPGYTSELPSIVEELPSIVENAIATPDLSTLVTVLTLPGYEPVLMALMGPGPFTVFAPTNEAFAAAGVDPADVAAVTEILKYHVVPGIAAFSTDLVAKQSLTTLEGSQVEVKKDVMGNIFVNGVDVVIPDVASSNGVVHVIDEVLTLPKSYETYKEAKPYKPAYEEFKPKPYKSAKPAYKSKPSKSAYGAPYEVASYEREYGRAKIPNYNSPNYNGFPCDDEDELASNGKFKCGIWWNMFPHERDVLEVMFLEKYNIRRKVTFVSDGVITKTHSNDAKMSLWIQQHIGHSQDMVARNDKILYHKPNNAKMWEAHQNGNIGYNIKWGDDGAAYIHQFGFDPCAVKTIQRHALDVNDFISEGVHTSYDVGAPTAKECEGAYTSKGDDYRNNGQVWEQY